MDDKGETMWVTKENGRCDKEKETRVTKERECGDKGEGQRRGNMGDKEEVM